MEHARIHLIHGFPPYRSHKSTAQKTFALLVFLLAGTIPAGYCQDPDTGRTAINLGLHAHSGFIIPHSKTILAISGTNPRALEADISFHFTGTEAWQYLKSYPRLGVSLLYTDFGNPQVLGHAYSLLAYAETFLTAHKSFSLSIRLGTGLAYLDNIYHPEKNPQNLFFSAPISFPLVANLMGNYQVSRQVLLRAGLSYNHISNGGLRQPNKGINYPTLSAGLNYALRPAHFRARPRSTFLMGEKKQELLLALIFSYPDRGDSRSQKAPLVGTAAYVSRRVGRLSALTAGAEWIANYALRPMVRQQPGRPDFQRGAILGGHEWRIGRIRFSQQLGLYVYAPYRARDALYQRYGLEYHSGRKLFGGLHLKAHRQVADFLDVRVGYKW